MGTKHDVLTEAELASYSLNPVVADTIATFRETSGLEPSQIRILDWGCGRGRSVAVLRDQGYDAYGVEIDEATMRNGFALFENRGWQPSRLLMLLSDLERVPNGSFHLIFSEQVFEHVFDLEHAAREQARLTRPGGLGIHCFPGALGITEDHLFMPCVHWLPKRTIRRAVIQAMLALGKGPEGGWIETRGKPRREQAQVYYEYLNHRTYYRDTAAICRLFQAHGFTARSEVAGMSTRARRLLPSYLRRNGFPNNAVRLHLMKREL